MNSKNLVLLFIVFTFSSCSFFKHSNSSKSIKVDEVVFQSKPSTTDSDHSANIESEDFVSNALNNYSISNLTKEHRYLKCSKKSIVNIHDSSVIDTIYTFSNSKNMIQIYRSKQKDLIFSFDVTDSKLKLNGNIYAGMSKVRFSEKFQITELINNTVKISNSNATIIFIFTFKDKRLNSIKSDLYID